ncbi:geranylgeranyl transferase type-1 subunit beta [Lecanora helva]
MSSPVPDRSQFHKQKHIKYWLRCLKTHLPTAYTSNDSQRVTLAFFILSALDLLGALHDNTTASERRQYADWILRCQHSNGGFRGFTGTMIGDAFGPCEWDAANLAGTYFALATLAVLEEGMDGVDSRKCLEWVAKLQRKNGSFGEGLGRSGKIEGGEDMRFAQLAAGVRWFLRRGDLKMTEDIDVPNLVEWIEGSVTYEGGIAQEPFHETHAGLTYTGVSALSLLGKISRKGTILRDEKTMSPAFIDNLIRWLVSRQTLWLHEEEDLPLEEASSHSEPVFFPPKFHVMGSSPARTNITEQPSIEVTPEERLFVGVNGRCNKVADTCYAFWVGGSLGILNKVHLLDFNGIRRYLLEKTQHTIGGFGKMPGDLPVDSPQITLTSHRAELHEIEMAPVDNGCDGQLRKWAKEAFTWIETEDTIIFRSNKDDDVEYYELSKKVLTSECRWLKACIKTNKDPCPGLTMRIANLEDNKVDEVSFISILKWMSVCKRIKSGSNENPEEPVIPFKDWIHDARKVTFLQWSQFYCMAEAMNIPRLMSDICTAVQLRALRIEKLPPVDAIIYLYEHGKKGGSELKRKYIEQYAIAMTAPHNVWGTNETLSRFPDEFVGEVLDFGSLHPTCSEESKARQAGYMDRYNYRRRGLKNCVAAHDEDV